MVVDVSSQTPSGSEALTLDAFIGPDDPTTFILDISGNELICPKPHLGKNVLVIWDHCLHDWFYLSLVAIGLLGFGLLGVLAYTKVPLPLPPFKKFYFVLCNFRSLPSLDPALNHMRFMPRASYRDQVEQFVSVKHKVLLWALSLINYTVQLVLSLVFLKSMLTYVDTELSCAMLNSPVVFNSFVQVTSLWYFRRKV